MNTTNKQRKEKAIELMKELEIYEPYIKGFEEENNVCFFERFAGFWAYQEPELIAKIKEIEEEYNSTVYAITHEYTDFGECYDFLLITDYEEEWDYLVEKYGRQHTAYAYVWNKTDEDCSELGTIAIESFGGGIRRIG